MSKFSGPHGGPTTGALGMNKGSFLPPRWVKISRVFLMHKELTVKQYHHKPSPPGSKFRRCLVHRTFVGSALGLTSAEGARAEARLAVKSNPGCRPHSKCDQPQRDLWNRNDPSKCPKVGRGGQVFTLLHQSLNVGCSRKGVTWGKGLGSWGISEGCLLTAFPIAGVATSSSFKGNRDGAKQLPAQTWKGNSNEMTKSKTEYFKG